MKLNEYVTETELNEALADFNQVKYVTESELNSTLNGYQPKGNYLTSIPSEYVTESELGDALRQKQDKLISGLTLKTVNGNSLLGMGDITIIGDGEGGSIDPCQLM